MFGFERIEEILGISSADCVIVIVYLAGITIVGTWAFRKVKTAASFFISDRKSGKIMMIFFGFGTGTHTDHAVTVAAKTYTAGASGIWYQLLWLFVTPFFWVLAPLFRRMRAVTTADYFEARYDRSVSVLYALLGMLTVIINIGVILKGSSAMITAVTGGRVEPAWAIGAMVVMFVTYGVAGGLNAAIITDFIQGLLTIVLSFLILPFALIAVGGMTGLREKISDPAMFEIVAPGEITKFYVAIIAFNALVGWVTQPHNIAVSAAGKTEMEGRVGVTVGMFAKRFCTIAWALTGLCAIALFPGLTDESQIDQVYGLAAADLLPKVAPGLVGVFIASMLAAVMSSCDAFMVSSAGLFTENIYRPFVAKNRSERHYVWIGRLASMAIVGLAIVFAFNLESVVKGLEVFWKIPALMGIAFWVGLFWRRATVAGAWAGTLVAFGTLLFVSKIPFFGHTLWDFNEHFAHKLPACMLWEDKLRLPWQMVFYLSAGFIALVVVSLFTRRVSDKRLHRFYECLRTPIVPGEPETIPFTLPKGTEPAPRRVLVDHPDFEIPRPEPVSIIGFLASCAGVGALIVLVYWVFSLGQ